LTGADTRCETACETGDSASYYQQMIPPVRIGILGSARIASAFVAGARLSLKPLALSESEALATFEVADSEGVVLLAG
jgi:hypothetical protein